MKQDDGKGGRAPGVIVRRRDRDSVGVTQRRSGILNWACLRMLNALAVATMSIQGTSCGRRRARWRIPRFDKPLAHLDYVTGQ